MIVIKGFKLPSWGMVDSCIYNLISTNNDDNDVQLLMIIDLDHNRNHQGIIDSQRDQSDPWHLQHNPYIWNSLKSANL